MLDQLQTDRQKAVGLETLLTEHAAQSFESVHLAAMVRSSILLRDFFYILRRNSDDNVLGKEEAKRNLAKQAAAAAQFAQAVRIINSIQNAEQKSLAQTAVVRQYVAIRDFESALQIARVITQADLKAIALGEISAEYFKTRQVETANQFLQQALNIVQTIRFDSDEAATLTKLATQMNSVGQTQLALQILERAQQRVNRAIQTDTMPYSLTEFANAEQAQIAQTRADLKLAQAEAARQQTLFEAKAISRETLDATIAAQRAIQRELDLLLQAQTQPQIAIPLPPPSLSPEDETTLRVEKLAQLAERFAAAQKFSKALTIATRLDSRYCQFKTETLIKVVQPAVDAQQLEAADQILSQALKTAQTVDDRSVRFELLLAIAKAYSKLKQPTRAAQILAQAEQLFAVN